MKDFSFHFLFIKLLKNIFIFMFFSPHFAYKADLCAPELYYLKNRKALVHLLLTGITYELNFCVCNTLENFDKIKRILRDFSFALYVTISF